MGRYSDRTIVCTTTCELRTAEQQLAGKRNAIKRSRRSLGLGLRACATASRAILST
jgi:hypothetical protein